jgi:hypothetical protein
LATKAVSLVAVLTLTLGFAACTKTLNTDSIEPQIEQAVEKRGIQVKSVECPGDVDAKKGDAFDCKVTTDSGRTSNVKVTQTNDEGNVLFDPRSVRP